MDSRIEVMMRPARSPHLNPIENQWVYLIRDVYAHFTQYEYEDQLIEAIKTASERISVSHLENPCESLPNRPVFVIQKQGGHSWY